MMSTAISGMTAGNVRKAAIVMEISTVPRVLSKINKFRLICKGASVAQKILSERSSLNKNLSSTHRRGSGNKTSSSAKLAVKFLTRDCEKSKYKFPGRSYLFFSNMLRLPVALPFVFHPRRMKHKLLKRKTWEQCKKKV